MGRYIDGFVLPIPKDKVEEYKHASEQIAQIWKEYGALEYCETIGDDMTLEGVRSFADAVDVNEGEVVIFGWVVFESKEARDEANTKVPKDARMQDLVAPLVDPTDLIFDPRRMVYGGFAALVG